MASDTANVKLGVCSITYDGVDLGYTKGGVEVEVTTDTHKVTIDQFGESIVNEYITKRDIIVKTPLAETTLDNLVAIMPGATLVVDSVDSNKKRVDVANGVGTNLLTIAKQLILHPIELAAGDTSEDLTVPLAGTAGAMNYAYKHDEERVFNTQFTGYPDPSTNILFKLGDLTATA